MIQLGDLAEAMNQIVFHLRHHAERARLLAALTPVSAAVIFQEDTADNLLDHLRPEIYVKGGDYHNKPLPERPLIESYGGRVVLIDYLPDHSTSALIRRIKALPE